MEIYELIIVGAGPGGMNAAIYAARFKLKTLVIGELLGGMASEAIKICNYLTYKSITGMEFSQKMGEQVRELEVGLRQEKVLEILKKDFFEVKTDKETYLGKKLILAMGSDKKKLGLKRENELLGKGVSYCATCDAPFFKDKIVGVLGGGNSALTAALLLSEFAKKIYIIYRQDRFFRAEPKWVETVEKNKKIEVIFKAKVAELKGKERLEGVKLDTGPEMKMDGLFVEFGGVPKTKLVMGLGVELEKGFVKVDKEMKTNIEGVFAAGDITNGVLKQIITAAADGAIAAISVYKELRK